MLIECHPGPEKGLAVAAVVGIGVVVAPSDLSSTQPVGEAGMGAVSPDSEAVSIVALLVVGTGTGRGRVGRGVQPPASSRRQGWTPEGHQEASKALRPTRRHPTRKTGSHTPLWTSEGPDHESHGAGMGTVCAGALDERQEMVGSWGGAPHPRSSCGTPAGTLDRGRQCHRMKTDASGLGRGAGKSRRGRWRDGTQTASPSG